MLRVLLAVLLMVTMQANSQNPTSTASSEVQPPVAKKIHTEKTVNGKTLTDDYAWLRERPNPDVKALLEAENAYAEYVMKPTEARQKKLYDEIVSHIKETDDTVPYLKDGYYYYTRTLKGKQYFELCRKKGSLDAPEQIILDLNKMAEGEKFMAVGQFAVSDDGNLLAYTTDNVGFRQYRLHIRDLRSMQDLPDTAERVTTIAWAADNGTLFYTVEDEVQKRSYRLYRHSLKSNSAPDPIIFEDKDERFNIEIGRTLSKSYLLLTSASHISTEVRFLAADHPEGDWTVIAPRVDNLEYYVDHRGDSFYIRTNDTAQTFRLVTAPTASPGKANWKELVAARPDVPLDNFDIFQNFYVLTEIVAGLPVFRVVQFADGSSKDIEFPEPAYFATSGANAEFNTDKFRYNYQSLVTPPSVFDYDVTTHQSALLKQNKVPGGFDRNNYVSERVFATASDGTRVPVSLFYRKDLKNKAQAPLYLYGYGSYGYALPITFSVARLPLVDRGLIVALAHIRGGGELGKPWHDAGKMMNKKNTFSDFIASAEYLTSHGYGSRARIGIEGASAGGLLMGAVTNMRPDLFRVVLSEVPFVDVMNTMLDASLPLTVPEYEEWGNPNTEPAFDYMLSYSPYDNLAKRNYPTMLVRTSFDDSQVMYWEPAKYVSKLRTLKTDNNPLVFYTNMHGGHAGSSGRYDRIHEVAFNWAFLLTQLDVPEPDAATKP
ncbi:MAG: S9 family peptidase [Candidatus Korobacteraceae bacterium]